MTEKIYRAKIHAKELLDCGFDPESPDNGWSVVCGILKAKGLPDWCVAEQTPVRISSTATGLTLEFQG